MAAFFILIILVGVIIASYTRIRDNQLAQPVSIANSISDVNNELYKLLCFTVGYYGSIIQLTGNQTYANQKTNQYLQSGLNVLSNSQINLATSFKINDESIQTNWFSRTGTTTGSFSVVYSIPNLGIYNISYTPIASLSAVINSTVGGYASVQVLKDNSEVDQSLTRGNFLFYQYNNNTKTWSYIQTPEDPSISSNGYYKVKIPSGVNSVVYYLQVVDDRGLMTTSTFVQQGSMRADGSTFNKKLTSFDYTFTWNSQYKKLSTQPMEVELLQNGTLRWLGVKLNGNATWPVPPVPIKSLRLNMTKLGVNSAASFQVEDWGSNFKVPFGLTSNTTILNGNNMVVFLINQNVTKVRLWWNDTNTITQTPNAYTTQFPADSSSNNLLDNGVITLNLANWNGNNGYVEAVTKTSPTVKSDLYFMRVNTQNPTYGSSPAYPVIHGVVRDIVQQEPEFSGGISGCPDVYTNVILTLPAGGNYFTYRVRVIFVSTSQTRTIQGTGSGSTGLSSIQLKSYQGSQISEDGVLTGGQLNTSTASLFWNGGPTSGSYYHMWSEYVDSNNRGSGIIFRDSMNGQLYCFDSLASQKTGSIRLDTSNLITEFDPVYKSPVSFTTSFDVLWVGAVLTFNSGKTVDSIYPSNTSGPTGTAGLWVLASYPPTFGLS